MNRRVEIRGEFREAPPAPPAFPGAVPAATVNGIGLAIDPAGRFETRLSGEPERIALDAVSARGSSVRASLPVPRAEIGIPDNLVATSGAAGAVRLRVSGRTQPGNVVIFRGETRPAETDGAFALEVELSPGPNVLDLAVRDAAGVSRAVRGRVVLSPLPATGAAR